MTTGPSRDGALGHDDHRARGVLQHPPDQPVVRLVLLRGELEVRPQRQQDQVAGRRLACDQLVRRADPGDLLVRHARRIAERGELGQQPLGAAADLGHPVLVARRNTPG